MSGAEPHRNDAMNRTQPTAESPTQNPVPRKERPMSICESCGPDEPVDQVFQCTLCTMNFCVKHLAPMAHSCFGALGKPQTIGVSG
jgi:predicted nucleic acid binding AN1-type Zn finger protein